MSLGPDEIYFVLQAGALIDHTPCSPAATTITAMSPSMAMARAMELQAQLQETTQIPSVFLRSGHQPSLKRRACIIKRASRWICKLQITADTPQ